MSRSTTRRIARLTERIGSLPIPTSVVRGAFDHFRATGVLPDNRPIALAVLRRAKVGVDLSEAETNGTDDPAYYQALVRSVMHAPVRPADEVMDALYVEAVSTSEMVRDAARHILTVLAEFGCDVTEPTFAKYGVKIDLPDWGPVGMRLLGFPECLVLPPYEEQANRLFTRYGALRERVDQNNPRWFDALAAATGDFREHGELPDDGLMRDCALAAGELECLLQHRRGIDVAELMAAFDGVAQSIGPNREAALGHLGVVYARTREVA